MLQLCKKHKPHFIIYSALIILAAYSVLTRVGESNWTCSSCHTELKERWAHSTHESVNCRSCHIEPGLKGEFKGHMDGLHNLWVSVTKGNEIQPHEDPVPIKSDQCLACHGAALYRNELGQADLPENALKQQGLKVAHRLHVEEYDISCVECHRGVTHRDPEDLGKYRTNRPLMHRDCGVCHDGQYWERFKTPVSNLDDQSKCTVCHPSYKAAEKPAVFW